jgi:hypothetical protein
MAGQRWNEWQGDVDSRANIIRPYVRRHCRFGLYNDVGAKNLSPCHPANPAIANETNPYIPFRGFRGSSVVARATARVIPTGGVIMNGRAKVE